MKLWAFVFIALFAAVFWGTSLVSLNSDAAARRGDGVRLVLQQWASRPRRPERCVQCAAALQNDESTYAVGALRNKARRAGAFWQLFLVAS